MNTTQPSLNRLAHVQSGFTLFEVMVAVVILVIGVLGAAGMTITAIRNSQQSGLRSTAVALAYEVGEIIRAYPSEVATFTNINTLVNPGTNNASCYGSGCSIGNIARHDLFEWARKVTDGTILPGGNAVICRDSTNGAATVAAPACDGLGPLVVKIWWNEKNVDGTITAANAPNVVVPISAN